MLTPRAPPQPARDTPSFVFEPPLALRTSAESEAELLPPVICSPLALACLVAGCTQLQAQSASAYCKRVRCVRLVVQRARRP